MVLDLLQHYSRQSIELNVPDADSGMLEVACFSPLVPVSAYRGDRGGDPAYNPVRASWYSKPTEQTYRIQIPEIMLPKIASVEAKVVCTLKVTFQGVRLVD